MGQVTVVKGAYSGYCLWSIQTDFRIPKLGKFSVQEAVSQFLLFPFFSCCDFYHFFEYPMARDDAEPNAYEYAGKGSPNASDNDEDTNVEPNASITKLLTTQGSRDSNESTNADAEDIGTMDTMEYILPTLRVRQEEGLLSQKDYDRIASLAESLLDVLAEADTGPAKQEAQETQEVQETRPADGSSSARPLDMEDGNRKISMVIAI